MVIDRNLDYEIIKTTSDDQERYLILDLKVQEKTITIAGLYAPNQDEPDYFVKVFRELAEHNNENLILCGDFNLVFDVELDRYDSTYNHKKSLRVLQELMDMFMLVDVWRMSNPLAKKYTWQRYDKKKKKLSASRIDYFLVNHGLTTEIQSDIVSSVCTDHSMITITIKLHSVMRGRGLWKLNTSLLTEKDYVDAMNEKLDEIFANFYRPRT